MKVLTTLPLTYSEMQSVEHTVRQALLERHGFTEEDVQHVLVFNGSSGLQVGIKYITEIRDVITIS